MFFVWRWRTSRSIARSKLKQSKFQDTNQWCFSMFFLYLNLLNVLSMIARGQDARLTWHIPFLFYIQYRPDIRLNRSEIHKSQIPGRCNVWYLDVAQHFPAQPVGPILGSTSSSFGPCWGNVGWCWYFLFPKIHPPAEWSILWLAQIRAMLPCPPQAEASLWEKGTFKVWHYTLPYHWGRCFERQFSETSLPTNQHVPT